MVKVRSVTLCCFLFLFGCLCVVFCCLLLFVGSVDCLGVVFGAADYVESHEFVNSRSRLLSVTAGSTIIKSNACKVRVLRYGDDEKKFPSIITGFAGSTADAFTLLERLEAKLDENISTSSSEDTSILKPCVNLAKLWRTDKYLRRLEATLLVASKDEMYELTGNGDVISTKLDCMAIGSGSIPALAAARALIDAEDKRSAMEIAKEGLRIAGEMCVYTNDQLTIEVINGEK